MGGPGFTLGHNGYHWPMTRQAYSQTHKDIHSVMASSCHGSGCLELCLLVTITPLMWLVWRQLGNKFLSAVSSNAPLC